MPGLVSIFLRLIRGRRYRLVALRRHGVGGHYRFRRRMLAIRHFGRPAAGRGTRHGYHAAGRGHPAAPHARGRGPHTAPEAPGCSRRADGRGHPAPMERMDMPAPAPPPGSPLPPPPQPSWSAWTCQRLRHPLDLLGMEASPRQEMATDSGSRAERRFGRLFGRVVAAIDRCPSRRPGSWAPVSLVLASAAPLGVVVVDSSSDEEG
ncbi:hypothetical protein ZWY2020_010214 [Hordeum vulgare]|nr:hypothetical protein ZWY2020_010214 [Hordeum vulgare]